MDNKKAYKIIGKHLFSSVHPYNAEKIIVILADNEDAATEQAKKYFNSSLAHATRLFVTENEQIYKV